MDAKVKEKWLAALRSGEYRKARGQLCKRSTNGARHCCLGVLRDVVGSREGDAAGVLNYLTVERTGLLGRQGPLIDLNDKSAGWDGVIAYIEANL